MLGPATQATEIDRITLGDAIIRRGARDPLSLGGLDYDWARDKVASGGLAQGMDERFLQGRAHFDGGEYFAAHEVWEDLWNELQGKEATFMKGLIQVAVALHHAGNRNFAGATKLLASSFGYVAEGTDPGFRVDVPKLRELIVDVELAVQKIKAGEVIPLPYFPLPLLEE